MKISRSRPAWSRVAACVLFSLAAVAAGASQFLQVEIPMRDGVELAANVSLPDGDGPWPVVLVRTPYNKDRSRTRGPNGEQGLDYLAAGYAYVIQDCRGRYGSDGEYRPFLDDMNDGYDTVEWVAEQIWSNGAVGMLGVSATGITANLAAMARPAHLRCAFVSLAHGSQHRYAMSPGGAYLLNLRDGWLRAMGVETIDERRPQVRVYNMHDERRDMRTYYDKIDIPIYNVGGWYDVFSQGAIDAFVGLQHQDAGEARGNQRLVMGAFGHNRLTGGLEFPQEAMDRHGRNAIRWFDRWLKGIENGIDAEPAVRYYLMGDPSDPESLGNLWREADDWPPPSTATSYYLGPERRLTLDAPTERAPSTSYSYNPRDPVPTRGGANMMAESGPLDQRLVGERSDVLKFETAPLESAVEVVGRVAVELHVRTDVEDTDFTVKLIDVHPNGYEALILDGALRLRHREGIDQMVRAKPDEVYKIEVDLWSTAIAFNRGHKIAIHVSSSNYPRFEPHPNTWLAIADMETESVIARNRIYHDVRRPSRLVLPVTKVYDPPAPR